MGVELLEIGNKMRKGVIFTMRGCFRSVCNHPFLVCMLCVLIYMYRSSPFVFSLLVSASPVLVCTAVLLGTLLCFGQPNIPEIEIEEKTSHEAVPLRTGLLRDATVVEKNESYYVERYSEKRRDEGEQPTGVSSLSGSKIDEIRREGSRDEGSRRTESENGEILEANRELDGKIKRQKTEWNEERFSDGEVMENHYASIPKVSSEQLESEYERSEADSFDSERVNVDSLESPPRSAWKKVESQDGEEEEDDASDSGSDRAESSSPDASIADIIPMLDELHPLLDEEGAQPVQMSRVGSDAASEQSPRSSTTSSSIESVDETENNEDSEVADNDNEEGEDDDDDDDDAQDDKEDQTKSAITWTEEDQKNLMELGSSEIERNKRLENLILRRSRKHMSMVPEINLIDLESSDFPVHIAPISTTRQNPFDLPNDSYDNSGIPGSAPSILLPRRNPFDIPYDSSEEKPNQMEDEFQEEVKTLHSREPCFRRRESFNVGPSVFAPNRQERHSVKLRPYFVPERMILEESSYSTLQRQSSEMSDSKASSAPETESVSSVEDLKDQKLEEEDDPQVPEVISRTEEVIEERPAGYQDQVSKMESSEEDVPYEPEVISEMKDVSEHVGHGSQSSEEEETLELGSIDRRDIEIDDLKFQSQDVEDHHEEGSVAQPAEVQAIGYNSSSEAVEQRYSRGSSASSLSEVGERVFTEIDGENLSMLDGKSHGVALEPDISRQTSDMSVTGTLVDDVPHKEPVYDSSPPAVRKNLSSSSSSSDVHAESDPGLPPVLVKRTVSESQEIEGDIPTTKEMMPEPSKIHLADEHESARVDMDSDFSAADQKSESQGASEVPGVLGQASVPSNSCHEASVEENLKNQRTQGQVPSSSSDCNNHASVNPQGDKNLGQSEEEKHLPISKRESPILGGAQTVEVQMELEHSNDKEETVLSPNSDADYHEANDKLISTPTAGGSTPLFYDIAMHRPDFEHVAEVQVPNTPVESSKKVRNIQNLHIPDIKSSFIPDSISRPSSASEEAISHVDTQTILEEADEIKEIDERLLSELDNVGDFSSRRKGSRSHELEKHIDSILSPHYAKTSSKHIVEVNSVAANRVEHEMHLGNSRDEIDIHEEDKKCISDLQTSQTSVVEQIDTSSREFSERDGQDSTDETSEEETPPEDYKAQHDNSVSNRHNEDNISEYPEVDMQSTVVTRKAEVMSHRDQGDIDKVPGMPELEFSDKEIEKPLFLNPPPAEREIGEAIAEHSEHGTPHINTSATDSTTQETPILEVRSIDYATSDQNQANDGNTGIHGVPDSADDIPHEVDSGKTRETSELHVAESTPSEGTSSPPNHSLDGNSEEELKPNTNDGSVEIKPETLDSSVGEESNAREVSSIAAEESEHEVRKPREQSTKSAKGKGKSSKSSSSSSSSSSESSSSDSD